MFSKDATMICPARTAHSGFDVPRLWRSDHGRGLPCLEEALSPSQPLKLRPRHSAWSSSRLMRQLKLYCVAAVIQKTTLLYS